MARDVTYTNGVIAVREKFLLGGRISKLCEGDAEEALRTLTECGFGKGAEVSSVFDYEKLVTADEQAIDEFIREYSPSRAVTEYLLCGRDFHNAKALIKAEYLGLGVEKMLAPDGLIASEKILAFIRGGEVNLGNSELEGAIAQAAELLSGDGASGAEVGIIFDRARFAHLRSVCASDRLLSKFIAVRADMTNILTALRSESAEYAEKCFVGGGKIKTETLLKLFDGEKDKNLKIFDGTPYGGFAENCLQAITYSKPLTQAERIAESYEAEYFSANRYDLKRAQPFLYYVFRRRAENANVRILFVCLLAGMRENEIKNRLRAV